MGIKSFVDNLNNRLARQFVSANYSHTELEELDIAILYIVNEMQNNYAKYDQWTIQHIDNKLKELGVPHSYPRLLDHIHKILEAAGLVKVGRWTDAVASKRYIEGSGNRVFVMPTEKGRKCLQEMRFYTDVLIRAKKRREKMNLKKGAVLGTTAILFFCLMVLNANAVCLYYSRDANNQYFPNPDGIYILCDYADLTECWEDLNGDYLDQNTVKDLNQCQLDLNSLQESYEKLDDDKNGIVARWKETLAEWSLDLNKISGLLGTISGLQESVKARDQNNLLLATELSQIKRDENVCESLDKHYKTLDIQLGKTKKAMESLGTEFSKFKTTVQGEQTMLGTGLATINSKADTAITGAIIVMAIIALAIVLPKVKGKIRLPKKKIPVPAMEEKPSAQSS